MLSESEKQLARESIDAAWQRRWGEPMPAVKPGSTLYPYTPQQEAAIFWQKLKEAYHL